MVVGIRARIGVDGRMTSVNGRSDFATFGPCWARESAPAAKTTTRQTQRQRHNNCCCCCTVAGCLTCPPPLSLLSFLSSCYGSSSLYNMSSLLPSSPSYIFFFLFSIPLFYSHYLSFSTLSSLYLSLPLPLSLSLFLSLSLLLSLSLISPLG